VPEAPLILIVEDEYLLQAEVKRLLTEAGFMAESIPSGEEALTLFMSSATPFRALVTDVNLSGSLNGWDLARQIREKESNFPVVYMTGAAADEWTSQGVPNSILLQKPFAPAQLTTAISNLLNVGPRNSMRSPQSAAFREVSRTNRRNRKCDPTAVRLQRNHIAD
jgi:DNA-binding response OmpR family regulator